MGKMGKMAKRKSASSIKMTNKHLNKAKKSKKSVKQAGKSRKSLKLSQKANNITLAKQRELEDLDEQAEVYDAPKQKQKRRKLEEDDEELRMDAFNPMRRANKRKPAEEELDDSIESSYKVKKYIKKGLEINRTKSFALPIKTQSGLLLKNTRIQEVVEAEEEAQNESDEDQVSPKAKKNKRAGSKNEVEEEAEVSKSALELIQEKKQILDKNKEKIAILSKTVLENPQEEMKKLKELRTMLTLADVKSSIILRKLIIVSLCEIFKDIAPGYKIRQWTEKENEQNAGKDVKQMRDYEENLLKQYKLYLDYVKETLKSIKNFSADESLVSLGEVCIKSLGSLVEKLPRFNFANEIIETIVHNLTSKTAEFVSLSCEIVKKLFREDKELNLSFEIAQKLAKLVKQKSFSIRPQILDLFLSLKLKEINVVEDEKSKKMMHKDKMKLSRTERKNLKEKEQLEKDLEEKKVNDKLKTKAKLQARILEQIFVVYFKILKKSPNMKLMPSVLEGLAKFAHLINLEFFDDLLKLMHQMIESERLSFRSKLHCIKTIFIVLSGQGEALTIDPMKFYNSLYNILLRIDITTDLDNTILLSECIDMMFFKRRKQIPTARLLAFVKRLSLATLQMEPTCATVTLNILRKMINMNKSCDLLFDNEYQDSGIYNAELPEPDYSNAQNTAVWELYLLKRHYNTIVRFEAEYLLKQQGLSLQDSKRTTEDVVQFMESEEKNIFENKIKK